MSESNGTHLYDCRLPSGIDPGQGSFAHILSRVSHSAGLYLEVRDASPDSMPAHKPQAYIVSGHRALLDIIYHASRYLTDGRYMRKTFGTEYAGGGVPHCDAHRVQLAEHAVALLELVKQTANDSWSGAPSETALDLLLRALVFAYRSDERPVDEIRVGRADAELQERINDPALSARPQWDAIKWPESEA